MRSRGARSYPGCYSVGKYAFVGQVEGRYRSIRNHALDSGCACCIILRGVRVGDSTEIFEHSSDGCFIRVCVGGKDVGVAVWRGQAVAVCVIAEANKRSLVELTVMDGLQKFFVVGKVQVEGADVGFDVGGVAGNFWVVRA